MQQHATCIWALTCIVVVPMCKLHCGGGGGGGVYVVAVSVCGNISCWLHVNVVAGNMQKGPPKRAFLLLRIKAIDCNACIQF